MEHWTDYLKRNAIPPEEAMELLARWQRNETAIGMMFTAGVKSNVVMRTQVQQVSAGRLELFDPEHPAAANFGLSGAGLSYGPVLMFPRWPLPPPVKVQGLRHGGPRAAGCSYGTRGPEPPAPTSWGRVCSGQHKRAATSGCVDTGDFPVHAKVGNSRGRRRVEIGLSEDRKVQT